MFDGGQSSPASSLTALANKFKSDKGTRLGNPPHRYSYLYDLMFGPYRDQEINFLEMGLAIGGPELGGPVDRHVDSPSIQMWLEYFPKANIYGFDISDFSHMRHPRFSFVRGDSGSVTDLARLSDVTPTFDIIIDDASHASYHQQLSLKMLIPKLAPGGLYIIEDLQWQPPSLEANLPKVPKTAKFLNSYFEDDVYIDNPVFSAAEMDHLKGLMVSFSSFPAFGRKLSPRSRCRPEQHTKLIALRKASNEAIGV